jgi:hypothetical protein
MDIILPQRVQHMLSKAEPSINPWGNFPSQLYLS